MADTIDTEIHSDEFADIIVAALKQEGIPFPRAMAILSRVGTYCMMPRTERLKAVAMDVGQWKKREVGSK